MTFFNNKGSLKAMIKIIGNKHVCATVSSIGGTVEDFMFHSENIIFPSRLVGNKSRGGIPICFPFFGKPTKDFSSIPQHGWLRHQVVFVGENKVTEEFPWKLHYTITVFVCPADASLTVNLITERLKDGCFYSTPINPGFHPYFCSDKAKRCIARGMTRIGKRVITDFKKESAQVTVDNPILIKSGKQTVLMELTRCVSQLTLWSDNPDEYFCVEPVLTSRDDFATPEDGRFLAEGGKFEMTMRLTVV